MSPVVNRRILLETVQALCKASQPTEEQLTAALDAMGEVVSDMTGIPVQLIAITKRSTTTKKGSST